jgi:hypothetical protein
MAAANPHTGPQDFHEGRTAAERFASAMKRIAGVPKSAAPRSQPHPRKTPKKK